MPEIVHEPDGSRFEYDFFPPREEKLLGLFRELFERHWRSIHFGPCIQGAVYEIALERAPRLAMLDGYLTIDTGSWHLHLCIGEHRKTTPEAAHQRRVARAAFFRCASATCVPESYGLRLWNGAGEQMITVFFPNPHLDDRERPRRKPDWTRLDLWQQLRDRYAISTRSTPA